MKTSRTESYSCSYLFLFSSLLFSLAFNAQGMIDDNLNVAIVSLEGPQAKFSNDFALQQKIKYDLHIDIDDTIQECKIDNILSINGDVVRLCSAIKKTHEVLYKGGAPRLYPNRVLGSLTFYCKGDHQGGCTMKKPSMLKIQFKLRLATRGELFVYSKPFLLHGARRQRTTEKARYDRVNEPNQDLVGEIDAESWKRKMDDNQDCPTPKRQKKDISLNDSRLKPVLYENLLLPNLLPFNYIPHTFD